MGNLLRESALREQKYILTRDKENISGVEQKFRQHYLVLERWFWRLMFLLILFIVSMMILVIII